MYETFVQKLLSISSTVVPLKCPQVTPFKQLNAEQYMGVWFEQSHVKGEFFQPDSSFCTQAYYFDLNDKGQFWVENSTQDGFNEERYGVIGNAECTKGNGECSVTFNDYMPKLSNYIILDTDYSKYSIVYSCFLGKEFLWLLTREPEVSTQYYNSLLDKVSVLVPSFDQSLLIPQEYQGSNCTYITPQY